MQVGHLHIDSEQTNIPDCLKQITPRPQLTCIP